MTERKTSHTTASTPSRRNVLRSSFTTLFAAMVGTGYCTHAAAQTERFQLVTPEEVAQFKDDVYETLSIPLSGDEPLIEVISPVIKDGKVASPVSIEVRFKPAAGKAIDSSTFKVYYGAFKIDVTSRLLKTAKVSNAGFAIDKADIPAGSHRLVMRVSDDSGATGLRELKFTVEG
jgi:hypothetical protein